MNNFFMFLMLLILSFVFDIPDGKFIVNFSYNLLLLLMTCFYYFLYIGYIKIQKNILFLFLFLICFFILYSFNDTKVSLTYFLLFFNNFILAYLLSIIAKKNEKLFVDSLDLVIYTHIFFLILQYFFINLMKIDVNFHEILFPFSAGHTYQLKNIDYIRITGLYNEPGTYSTWISILCGISMIIRKRILLLHYLAFMTILITFSATGFFFCALFIILVIYEKLKYFKLINILYFIVSILLFFIIFFYSGVYDYIMWRFFDDSVVDGTSDLKFEAFNFLLNSSQYRQIFGSGLGVNDCINCRSLQDVGLLFNYIFYFGLFSFIPIIIILSFMKKINRYIVITITILFLSKVFIYTNIFWIAIMLMYSFSKYRGSKDV